MKRYRMLITALSPIHIGTGEEITPFEYLIKKDEKLDCWLFYRIDLTKMLSDLPPSKRKEFDRVTDSADISSVRKFILENVRLEHHQLYPCGVNYELVQAYQQNLKNPHNQLIIHPHLRRADTWQAIIPGSSIKGAIRTAVVSSLMSDWPPEQRIDFKNFESEVLNYSNERGRADIRRDPFRCLQIADADLPLDGLSIDPAVIFKPGKSDLPDPAGIQMFYEITYSRLDGENVTAQTRLSLDDKLPFTEALDKKTQQKQSGVSMPLDVETIRKHCLDFYQPKMQEEHERFYQKSADLQTANEPLLQETFGPLEFPLRLGRFSHVECVTVDKFRQPNTRRDRRTGRPIGYGNTRTLAARRYPLGWVRVSLEPLN